MHFCAFFACVEFFEVGAKFLLPRHQLNTYKKKEFLYITGYSALINTYKKRIYDIIKKIQD